MDMLKKEQIPLLLEEGKYKSEIDVMLKDLGKFYTFCQLEKIWIEQEGKKTELRNTLDFFRPTFEENVVPYSETKTIEPVADKSKYITETKTFRFDFDSNDNFEKILEKIGIGLGDLLTSKNKYWYKSNIVWPAGNAYMFSLNSKIDSPSWLFIGCENELKNNWEGRNFNTHGSDDGAAVESSIFGINRSAMPELFPCTIVRFRQELIFIEKNRLNDIGAEEFIDLKFPSTGFGYTVINNNQTYLKYVLKNAEDEIIGEDKIIVDRNSLVNGLKLKPTGTNGDKRIYFVDLELWIGDTLVDWSSSGYLRSIKISASINK